MARIFFAWELGEGFGHLTPIKPVLAELKQRGHDIFAAACDVSSTQALLGDMLSGLVQAPRTLNKYRTLKNTSGYADLLHLNGYADESDTQGRLRAWRSLYALFKPDVVIADHSPGALLAARCEAFPVFHTGTGFSCPPVMSPQILPYSEDVGECLRREKNMLATLNRYLDTFGGKPMAALSDLTNEVEDVWLMTFAELDHYGERQGCTYHGLDMPEDGALPDWPTGSENDKRIFAYLKPLPTTEKLLEAMKKRGVPVLLYPDRIPPDLLQKYHAPHIKVIDYRLNLRAVSEQATLVVHNANHGTAGAFIRGGVPQLCFPTHQEQQACARRLTQEGLANAMLLHVPEKVEQLFNHSLDSDKLRDNARKRAQTYARFDYAASMAKLADQVERVL